MGSSVSVMLFTRGSIAHEIAASKMGSVSGATGVPSTGSHMPAIAPGKAPVYVLGTAMM